MAPNEEKRLTLNEKIEIIEYMVTNPTIGTKRAARYFSLKANNQHQKKTLWIILKYNIVFL